MVEHSAVNQVVVGSSPTRGVKRQRDDACKRGCCKIDINCLWSNGSIFMPIIRKAGSEEPAIHGIISYDE